MIENVTWYLGGYYSLNATATADTFYIAERGDSVYSGRPTSTTGYIGLMYMSDYGYSALASSCPRSTNLGSYNRSTCAGQSWLYGQGSEWTITPCSSSTWPDKVFRLLNYYDDNPNANSSSVSAGYKVRPVLYLKSDVYVLDGDGSITDPYIIGM